ncbi:MAG: HAD-IC family P-type ATPase [bacterium]|nr:HAD-IC family P-type ATPase [bacterium]
MPDITFFNLSVEDSFKQLDAVPEGISDKEATRRRGYYGANRLPEEKQAAWFAVFIEQFKSPLVYVLLVASGISFILNEPVDATVIAAAVVIQVVVGFVQEFRAQKSLAALKKVISLSARVIRSGKEATIKAEDLVPGDIVLLNAGDKVPADIRLCKAHDFEVNEAPLTGESEPILKQADIISDENVELGDQKNMSFTGTVATKGKAEGVVVYTGVYTELGKIAKLIKDTKQETTPLQEKLNRFSKKISIAVVGIAVMIFAFGYITNQDLVEMFTVSVAVAVSAIPEGLAVAVTIILAVGMQKILKRKALVRKLVAAETLGSTNVICTDKTGTLTEGNMQVTDFVSWEHDFDVDGKRETYEKGAKDLMFALRLGILCNDAKVDNADDTISNWVISGNLTERALLLAGSQAGLHITALTKEAPRIDTIPFDSAIKYMATLHREAQGRMLYVKGAPEIVSAMCTKVMMNGESVNYDDEKRDKFEKRFYDLSKRGLRIIALAYKNTGADTKKVEDAGLNELTFAGYIGIKDPLRAEAKQTVAACKSAGIKTVMITGDHKLTAQSIAKELGMKFGAENVMEGYELDKLDQAELNDKVKDISVYARVTPEHKLRIVHAWQANKMVVAMTGDGINDSPAIKAADIGVALGSGTDVAKETADMVILDDNFNTIVAAVEEGRGVFDNIRKTILYLLSDSFSEVILIVGGLFMGLPVPITAAQILWINLIDDSFPSLAMTQEPKEPESMKEPPRGRDAEIMNREVKALIVIISVVTGLTNLALFYYYYTTTGDVDLARTVIFLSLGLDSLIYMFSVRSMRKMIWQKDLFSNKWLIIAFFMGLLFQIIPIYVPFFQHYIGTVPLGIFDWEVVIALSILVVVLIETVKYFFVHKSTKLD